MRNKIILLFFITSILFFAVALPAQTENSIEENAGAVERTVTTTIDTSKQVIEEEYVGFLPKDEFQNNTAFMIACIIAFAVFLGWLGLVIIYYIWAINKYVQNYGLSNHEWKVLYPEIYAAPGKVKKYQDIRKNTIEQRRAEVLVETGDEAQAQAITTPLEEPTENPYTKDSFGLPPGTIRGTLALTALVMFLLIEGVNLFSSMNLETHFDGLITALKMVLAFYFGSRAVDALKSTETTRQQTAETVKKNVKSNQVKVTKTVVQEEELPNEKPAMASRKSAARIINLTQPEEADNASPKVDDLKKAPLSQRILALTASFETNRGFPQCHGIVTGNFDGQGISYGALQWNIGQRSLQPLFRKMHTQHDKVLKSILGSHYDDFIDMLSLPLEQQMEWAKGIQLRVTNSANQKIWKVTPDWQEILNTLGQTPEMIAIQVESAMTRYNIALANCEHFKLTTERAAALMFDINVQNGRIGVKNVIPNIWNDYNQLSSELSADDLEVERMKIIAQRRAEASYAQWRKDVLSRKMTIAEGHGKVHGKQYDLEEEFNIGLKPLA